MQNKIFLLIICSFLALISCKENNTGGGGAGVFQLLKVSAGNTTLSTSQVVRSIEPDSQIIIEFSDQADTVTARNSIELKEKNVENGLTTEITFENGNRRILVNAEPGLNWNTEYELTITDELKSAEGTEFPGIQYSFITKNGEVELVSASINGTDFININDIRGISYDDVEITFTFSEAIDENTYQNYFSISPQVNIDFSISGDNQTVTVSNTESLDYYRFYTLAISSGLTAQNGFQFSEFEGAFQTGLDTTNKFPVISDEDLLTKVQEATFGYFWDFAHPVSGLARERNTSGETVTTGGSGFGLMAILVGIERGFISRTEGVQRVSKIVDFLAQADRFHGVWPHWMNGSTGDVIPFSTYDNGGDLVETAFMAQGLITVREYLDENNAAEKTIIENIDLLLSTIEWDWYTRGGQNVLYWHWSPEHDWRMNLQIKGYNEALIIYLLAASSADYGIDPVVYNEGWASSGSIVNGNSFYGFNLPVGYNYGGPLFFAHYSFLGLDPRGLTDTYADYWTQNINHSLINRQHSIENPNNFIGYSSESWGLTASDEQNGYGVHEPTRDNGTITPTAAISSIPYTPEESMNAIRHFYYKLGDKLWGEYGFYDAFNPTQGWWASSYLAIDQGPIVVMIENHRTGLLWNLFMSAPEVQTALDKLNFTY